MTEMMTRYGAETDECATWTWHEREFLTDDYIAWLEAQLTWRPVSEKPEKGGEYLCTWDFSDSIVMYYDDSGWSVWDASWDDYIDTANPPKYWLPIPPAPQGE